ncbi:MAG: hypothetical protein JSU03_12570 [Bacteroidetes bacterium]|nr:hypothetical protein [Bacteroidota bacterium]MBS1758100.1 hypothetical protein [Bacteroidota bacterium]
MKKISLYSKKFILIVLTLQILNISVNGCEYTQRFIDEKGRIETSKNQIDSLAEYVTEILLGHRNAIPEFKHNHTKNDQEMAKTQIQFFAHQIPEFISTKNSYPIIVNYFCYNNQYYSLFYPEINPPPPKQA